MDGADCVKYSAAVCSLFCPSTQRGAAWLSGDWLLQAQGEGASDGDGAEYLKDFHAGHFHLWDGEKQDAARRTGEF